MTRSGLTPRDWTKVVLVAGIGTILEWFDFYIYAQMTPTLKKVFFPSNDETSQALAFWGVYAVGFIVRPLGAIIFGHIGDTYGRNRTLSISIVCMALPTVVIGCLPTYGIGSYTANPAILAPIFLAIMRLFQGLAVGGEFGAAVVYISELAGTNRRGTLVACLQMTVKIGMILATLMVMLLENTMSEENLLIYGWRIPFLLAFGTAMLGFVLRRGMPEPKAFLAAARAEKEAAARANGDAEAPAALKASAPSSKSSVKLDGSQQEEDDDASEEAFEECAAEDQKAGPAKKYRFPILRLLMNNWASLLLQISFMAWISGAFYCTVTWLPAELRKQGMKPILCQGAVIVSMLANALGLLSVGVAFDCGMRAVYANAAVVFLGMGTGFGVFYGVWTSNAASWCLMTLFNLFLGAGTCLVALPSTRLYAPLVRTTGFSFGYNCGTGIIGGLTPVVITAIRTNMSDSMEVYAAPLWLLALGSVSLIGCALMLRFRPRLNKKFVGHIE